MKSSRRHFIKSGVAGAGAIGIAPLATATTTFFHPGAATTVKLGVASYSLRKFSRADAIAMCQDLGIEYINIKSFHIRHEDSKEERMAARKEIEKAGFTIVGGGTITMHDDTDEAVRANFEYARDCGMPLMVVAPKPEVVPRIERFVKEYDIKVAIHNHGPEDKYFPAPSDVLSVVKGMDPRIGCCVDVGHTARTGVDVVEAIVEAGDRVLDMHMKDLGDMTDRDSQVAVGEGKMPVSGIFRQLMKMDYQGYVNLEYEIFADDPLPGMMKSMAYMRGVLAGLKSA